MTQRAALGGAPPRRWRFFIDQGGTFTDCIALSPTGQVSVHKVPTRHGAVLTALRQAQGLTPEQPLPPCELRLGSTVATNALLERRGAPCALLTTQGFADTVEIGTQARPLLFSLEIVKPKPLTSLVLETPARVSATGEVLAEAALEQLTPQLRALLAQGVSSLAIAVLHGQRAPRLEVELGALAERLGFQHVALSHRLSPEPGLLARSDTALLDAYLTPLLRAHSEALQRALPGSELLAMQSSGSLVPLAHLRGGEAILSGPAGGVVAAARLAALAGVEAAVGLDMGGTSTDVCRTTPEPELEYESEVSGVRVRAPMLRVHTVAAGGGSICRARDGRLTVGPESAGAHPGPLAYGAAAAEELTLTDCALALGRLRPERFPLPLRPERVTRRLEQLARELGRDEPLALAADFVDIAEATMADAVARVTTARGHDPRAHALAAFGGAAGGYVCGVARRLGIRRVLLHPWAGVLSAWGIGLATRAWRGAAAPPLVELSEPALAALGPVLEALERAGRSALGEEGRGALRYCSVSLRRRGTETSLTLPLTGLTELRQAFVALHRQRFGWAEASSTLELSAVRLELRCSPGLTPAPPPGSRAHPPLPPHAELYVQGRRQPVPLLAREQLHPERRYEGPLLVLDATSTLWVEPGFVLCAKEDGLLELVQERHEPPSPRDTASEPVSLAILGGAFMSIAEQMGVVLQRTARSTNIRDRLDFSCALFDAAGHLVANAPHVPVHLGAMGESVRAVLAAHPTLGPGEAFVTNDPTAGGSHLPDITVISPVFDHAARRVAFVASRGHHADVGGITPGSMSPRATRLSEEGACLRALRLLHRGVLDEQSVRQVLEAPPFPARRPEDNLADLHAQLAANQRGQQLLLELCAREGTDRVVAYLGHVQDEGERLTRLAIERLPAQFERCVDRLDDGTPVVAAVERRGGHLWIDFSGTGGPHPFSLNAPRAVSVAAVMYVLRCLFGPGVPLNDGVLRAVTLVYPTPSLLSPPPDAAVSGGNVETSQRVVDVLLGALGLAAASQGTMNNLSFGDDSFGYYETLGGGSGAGPGFHGASGVQTHMTNTRLTDVELLEQRFPVRVERFCLRRGSGGAGRWRGGDGLVRELRFLRPVQLSLLTERRDTAPWGLAGGLSGAPGRNWIDGHQVGGHVTLALGAGSVVRIETPGGGGYGRP